MRTFGPYTNLVEIGRGGMATVYRATAPDGHLVALKILGVHLANDRIARTRFEQESTLKLIHPNIVGVHKAGVEGDTPFIEMDYVTGESLERWIDRTGPLPPRALAPILRDTAEALDFAHAHNVIHRDVKPSNIIVRGDGHENGKAMLADFGVAKAAGVTAYTATQARVGSVYYMSPEQASGAIELTPASDIYSLGVTAFYALTGQHPFDGDNDVAIARMHVDRRPPHVSDVNPKVPRHIGDVVMQALEKSPARRPISAGAFARAFAAAVTKPITRTLPPSVPLAPSASVDGVEAGRVAASSTAVESTEATVRTEEQAGPRIPSVYVIAGIALAAVLGMGAIGLWALGQSNPPPPTPTPTSAFVIATVTPLPTATLAPDQVLTPLPGTGPLPAGGVIILTPTPQPPFVPNDGHRPPPQRPGETREPPVPIPNVTSPVISPLPPPTSVPTLPPPPTAIPPTPIPTLPPPTSVPTLQPPPTAVPTDVPTLPPPPTEVPTLPPPTSAPTSEPPTPEPQPSPALTAIVAP